MPHPLFEIFPDGDPVHHPDRLRWTEESFLDMPKHHEHAPSAFLGVFQGGNRMRVFFFCVCAVFFIFFSRLFYLQVIEGRSFAALADRNRIRIVVERATRGLILDAHERPLVTNKPEFILTLTPAELARDEKVRQETITTVARLLREAPLTLTEEIAALSKDPFIRRQALPFREQLDYASALQFFAAEKRMSGFQISVREQRAYPETYAGAEGEMPMPESIAHVIGYLGKITTDELPVRQKQGYLASDLVGRSGIERFYDGALHGAHGKTFIEIDALGQEKSVLRKETSVAGKRLSLALDLDLQSVFEDTLTKRLAALPKRERKGAVGIAIDPRNGEIRALVSLPAYPARLFSGKTTREDVARLFSDPGQPLFPRAISGEYPSGSTIKPLIALAALEESVITPATTIVSTGGVSVGPWFFPDWKAGGHGATDVRRAIAESVNTFFYTIGGGYGGITGLGVDRIETWMKKFYFGETIGIDLPGEASGLIPTPNWKKEQRGERWYIGDTYHLAIGQGDILVTPLQIAAMTSVFANGGTLWQPTLVKTETPRALAADIASQENIRVVREGMRRTVTGGSAQYLGLLPIAVAGKTGTAQWSSKRPPHAWFTGFAPYNNPELVVTVLVEEGGDGSAIAVPVAYDVLQEYFRQNPKFEYRNPKQIQN